MAVNGKVIEVGYDGGIIKWLTLILFWTGTYTNNPAGDILDLTNITGADAPLPGQFPGGNPTVYCDNGGDMGNGAYIGIIKGATLKTWAIRYYQANGTELATNAAYPAGTPATAAASNVQISFGGRQGKF